MTQIELAEAIVNRIREEGGRVAFKGSKVVDIDVTGLDRNELSAISYLLEHRCEGDELQKAP